MESLTERPAFRVGWPRVKNIPRIARETTTGREQVFTKVELHPPRVLVMCCGSCFSPCNFSLNLRTMTERWICGHGHCRDCFSESGFRWIPLMRQGRGTEVESLNGVLSITDPVLDYTSGSYGDEEE